MIRPLIFRANLGHKFGQPTNCSGGTKPMQEMFARRLQNNSFLHDNNSVGQQDPFRFFLYLEHGQPPTCKKSYRSECAQPQRLTRLELKNSKKYP